MPGYQSKAATRLAIVWQRMPAEDRRVVCSLGGLVAGAELAPIENFSDAQLQRIAKGMRAVVGLAAECRFALSYGRTPAKPRNYLGTI